MRYALSCLFLIAASVLVAGCDEGNEAPEAPMDATGAGTDAAAPAAGAQEGGPAPQAMEPPKMID